MWAFAILDLERRRLVCAATASASSRSATRSRGSALRFASEIKGAARRDADARARRGHGGRLPGRRRRHGDADLLRRHPAAPTRPLARRPARRPRRRAAARYWTFPAGTGAADGDAARALRGALPRQRARSTPAATCRVGTLPERRAGLVGDRLHRLAAARRRAPAGHVPHLAFGYVPPDASFSERRWMDMVVAGPAIEPTASRRRASGSSPPPGRSLRQQDEPFGSTSIARAVGRLAAARAGGHEGPARWPGRRRAARRLPRLLGFRAAGLLGRAGSRTRRRALDLPAPARRLAAPRRLAAVLFVAGRAPDARAAARQGDGRPTLAPRLRPPRSARPGRPEPLARRDQAAPLPRVRTSLPSLLRYEDRNSMALSIEARLPFLDYRLVELSFPSGRTPRSAARRPSACCALP